MKIAIDASRANIKNKTGVEWYAYHIINELKSVIPSHIEVVLYSRDVLTDDLARLPSNWSREVLHWSPKFLWTQIRLGFELLMNKPDILFIPSSAPPILHPRNTVVTVHDIVARDNPELYSKFQRWYSLFTARYSLRHCVSVIVPTKAVAEDLKLLKIKVKARVCIVYHGFTMNKIEESITKLSFGITKPYIIAIGRIEKKKNLVRLIDAFDKLKKNNDIQLVLVGKYGNGCDEIMERCELSEYKKDIIFTDYVDDVVKLSLLRDAKALVYPSLNEGFGLNILEAYSVGVPAVVSDVPAMREVGLDACVYFDPTNSDSIAGEIQSVLNDDSWRNTLIERGHLRLPYFSWTRCAEETCAILLQSSQSDK